MSVNTKACGTLWEPDPLERPLLQVASAPQRAPLEGAHTITGTPSGITRISHHPPSTSLLLLLRWARRRYDSLGRRHRDARAARLQSGGRAHVVLLSLARQWFPLERGQRMRVALAAHAHAHLLVRRHLERRILRPL